MYAVVDVETTGLHAKSNKIIEVAVVQTDLWGEWQDQWTTLIQPDRDVGPTSVHGITATDLLGAPRFQDVVGKLNSMFTGRTLVAHNLMFDYSFLSVEYERLGLSLPVTQHDGVCTMQAASQFIPQAGRTLSACCSAAGVRNEAAHTALADARATAQLLRHYLRRRHPAPPPWAHQADRNRTVNWPQIDSTGVAQRLRGSRVQKSASSRSAVWLDSLTDQLPRIASEPQADSYLALVDRVLADRDLTAAEINELGLVANELGYTNLQLRKLHREYLRGLCQVAYADGVIGADEHGDLVKVTELLRLKPADLAQALDNARVRRFPAEKLPPAGSLIAFTGDDPVWHRELLEAAAQRLGLEVHDSVIKKVSMLVASDFNTQSGKAKKARAYATPIMTVDVFARLVGLVERHREAT